MLPGHVLAALGTQAIHRPAPAAANPSLETPVLFSTTLVGGYPQPEWLIDRARLAGRFPARTRARAVWRIPDAFPQQAQDDATRVALRARQEAGLDIVTDGGICRESYSNRFATGLSGVDIDNPGTALDRSGHPNPVPRIVGPVRRLHPVRVADLQFLEAHTSRKVKITVPGPFTMSEQAQNDCCATSEDAALACAQAVNEEIRDLFAAGADIVQIDAPRMQARPERARQCGLKALNRALEGIAGETAVPICLGYAAIETPRTIVARIRRALPRVAGQNVVLAPDCGMRDLPREVADGKLRAMVRAARMQREEFA